MRILEEIHKLKNKITLSTNFKNSIIFTAFAFMNNGVNFLLIMTLAAYLSPAGYGTLNLFNTLILILAILIPLGTTGYIGNSYFRMEKDELKRVLNVVFLVGCSMFFFLLLVVILGGRNLENTLGLSTKVQIIALAICFSQLLTTINLEIWRLQEQPIKYGIYTMVLVVLNCSVTLYFVVICNWDWEGRIYAQLLISTIFFIISFIFLFRKRLILQTKINKEILVETLKFGIPLIPHMLTAWMRQGVDRYIINAFLGAASVGIFSFALNFGNIIFMVGTAFNASNAVFIYKKLASNDSDTRSLLKKQTRTMIIFFMLFFTLTCITSYILIPIFFSKYVEALPLLFPLCLSATFQCIYLLYVNYLFYYKKTNILMYITVTISLLHIILSYILSKYAIIYTAYINLISNFVICILVIIISQRYYPLYKKNN